ncbi:MAG: ion transporter [Rubrobacteraceae bacterium]
MAAKMLEAGKDRLQNSNKRRVYEILEPAEAGDLESRIFDVFIVSVIIVSVLAAMLRTMAGVIEDYGILLRSVEVFCIIIFTDEYLFRLWSCTADERYKRPVLGRLKFMFTPLAVVDLIAFLPFYLILFFPGTQFAGATFIFRLLRIFKMFRYSESLRMFAAVFVRKRQQLAATFSVTLVLLVFSSSLMYFAERNAQPEAFSSIPATLWWGAVTLTTVGYGDVYPVTPLGQIFGAVTALLGIGLVALPSGILASGFVEGFGRHENEEDEEREEDRLCPHCGRDINEEPEEYYGEYLPRGDPDGMTE